MTRDIYTPEQLGSGEVLPIAALQEARELGKRFPAAGLRPVTLVRTPELDELADSAARPRVWLALENLQVTGSFKVRGALCALASARRAGHDRVVAASAGNHGAGIAHAARMLGMQAKIVVPETTPTRKLQAMRLSGIAIERVSGGYDDAQERALQLAEQHGVPFVSPYDDPLVAAGNGGSLGFEIIAALGHVPERVVVPIGGGGLATGLACALSLAAGEEPERRRVWTAQSEASPAFALSIQSGQAIESLEVQGSTLAEGLEGGISARSFGRTARVVGGVSVVTEGDIAEAMRKLWQLLGLRVEGSGAAALVPVLQGAGLPCDGDLVVVLTGRNVDDEVFRRVVADARAC